MPGMLSEENQPSSGPTAPTPPATVPGAGNPPGGRAPGPEQSDSKALVDEAVKLVYGERFDQLIEMFRTNGPEKFPRSMAIAVNTAISELEKKHGEIGPEIAAEVGSQLFAMLLEDMATKPQEGMEAVVPGIGPEQLQEVLPAILVMYADSHPNVSKEEVQAVMQEVDQQTRQQLGAGGAQQSGETGAGVAPAPGKPEGRSPASPPPGSVPPGGM